MAHVPYKGTPAAYTDLMSGRVQLMFDNIVAVMPHIKSGAAAADRGDERRTRAVAARCADGGRGRLPGFEAVSWIGALVPAGTPKDVVDKIYTDLVAVLRMPDIKERLAPRARSWSATRRSSSQHGIETRSPSGRRRCKELRRQARTKATNHGYERNEGRSPSRHARFRC